MSEEIIKIEHVSKEYRLGMIGGTTLRDELQRKSAKLRGKEDPTRKVTDTSAGNAGERFLALDDINLTINKGERVGIIGHNGAGKSTLLKLLSRITAPSRGSIELNGRIASMLEVGTGFHGELSGRENIYMNGAILGMSKAEIDSKMEDIIEFSECRQFIDTPVKRYSSGMYVKLAFSVAAHLDSEIMIMDEVLAVGDMQFQKKCLDKMNDVSRKEGRTILYVSHNMNTIRQLCDRCIVLDHGKLIFDGDVEEAINLYMNVSINNNISIDYSDIPRLKWLENTAVKTLSARYIEKENIYFEKNEELKIQLSWLNEEDVKNLNLRVEILENDRRPVGTAFLKDFYSGAKDDVGKVELSVDISMLAPGNYTMNYTFFLSNEFGSNADTDCVHGLYFVKNTSPSGVIWNKKHWGYIELPPIKKL